jgi:SAM-dependent methyltransferase
MECDRYFGRIRSEIEPLLPSFAARILDVGCGAGRTSAWLASKFPKAHIIGLEGNSSLKEELTRNVTEAHIVDLNDNLPDVGLPDLVLFLDVLEHLLSPESVLRRLTANLAEAGTVIVSLPNIAHLSVALPLLLQGRFEYKDAGILDRTHLHFFVRESIIGLLNRANLIVERGLEYGLGGPRSRLVDRITFGSLRARLVKQYIVAGRRMREGEVQGRVCWILAEN